MQIYEQNVGDAIEAIYDALSAPGLWPVTLDRISRCFDAQGAALITLPFESKAASVSSPGVAGAIAEYQAHWRQRDIRLQRGMERSYLSSVNRYFTDRDVVTETEIDTLPLYVDFLAKHSIDRFMGGVIVPVANFPILLLVQRSKERGAFSDLEVRALEQFGRHAEKSLRLSLKFSDLDHSFNEIGEIFSRQGTGLFVTEETGKIVFSNGAAFLPAGRGLSTSAGRLIADEPGDRSLLAASLSEAANADGEELPVKSMLIGTRLDAKPLALFISSHRRNRSPPLLAIPSSPRAFVAVIDPTNSPSISVDLVREIFGLTHSEAKLASLVGAGKPPREAAQMLGIAEATARVVLKRVFSKVGVSRQAELAVILGRLGFGGC